MIYNNTMTLSEKLRMVAYYIFATQICNTGTIQRYFQMHYNTAMTIVEILEKLGIVSDFDFEIRGRKVLVSNIDELERKLDFYF
jgi:DNA segregation ATPase FtsK/SpoIIIE-like protein